jgi:hypothetical protein
VRAIEPEHTGTLLRCALLLALVSPGSAFPLDSPQSLGVHTVSAHSASGYNGSNPGIYLHWRGGVTIGAFHNSYRRGSAYAAWLWHADDAGRFGVLLGAATGYGSTSESMPLAPIVAPTLRVPISTTASARVSLFPDPRKGAVQALHLSFEWALR